MRQWIVICINKDICKIRRRMLLTPVTSHLKLCYFGELNEILGFHGQVYKFVLHIILIIRLSDSYSVITVPADTKVLSITMPYYIQHENDKCIIYHGLRYYTSYYAFTWWRHQMETFSELLALCAGNSQVTGEFPPRRPVTWSFGVFFHMCLNKRLSKQSWGWWFEKPLR